MSAHRRSPSFANTRYNPISTLLSPVRVLSRLASRISALGSAPAPAPILAVARVPAAAIAITRTPTSITAAAASSIDPSTSDPTLTIRTPSGLTSTYRLTTFVLSSPDELSARIEALPSRALVTDGNHEPAANPAPSLIVSSASSSVEDSIVPRPDICSARKHGKQAEPEETSHILCCFRPYGLCDIHGSSLSSITHLEGEATDDCDSVSNQTDINADFKYEEWLCRTNHLEGGDGFEESHDAFKADSVRTYEFGDSYESGRLAYSPPLKGATYNRWVYLPHGADEAIGLVRVIGDVDFQITESGDQFQYFVYCETPGSPTDRYWTEYQVGEPHPLAPNYYLQHHHNQAPSWVYQAGTPVYPPLEDRFIRLQESQENVGGPSSNNA